jgi:hypothetical protein
VAKQPADSLSELEALDPVQPVITLTTGWKVEVQRLRTRQFFRLLKVLTQGAHPEMLRGLNFEGQEGAEFTSQLLMLLLFSIPEAEQAAIEFVQSMVAPDPAVLVKRPKLSEAEAEANALAWGRHAQEVFNPELDDTVSIIEKIIELEAPHIQALGKRVGQMLAMARKTGQLARTSPEEPPGQEELTSQGSSAASQPRSTSSAPSTDGQTSGSGTSPSPDSGKSPRRSPAAGTESSPASSG